MNGRSDLFFSPSVLGLSTARPATQTPVTCPVHIPCIATHVTLSPEAQRLLLGMPRQLIFSIGRLKAERQPSLTRAARPARPAPLYRVLPYARYAVRGELYFAAQERLKEGERVFPRCSHVAWLLPVPPPARPPAPRPAGRPPTKASTPPQQAAPAHPPIQATAAAPNNPALVDIEPILVI